MVVYLVMYLVPALCTLVMGSQSTDERQVRRIGMGLLLIAFAVLIGLRFQVGTDWFNYQRTVYQIQYLSLRDTFAYKDPGFGLLTWISTRLGLGIYGANLVCGAALMAGLLRFARRQPDAWLVVTAAVPYLVIVVGMGYVRQAASIGFILQALIAFDRRNYASLAGWSIAAALFHGPAVCVLVPIALAYARQSGTLLFATLSIGAILFPLLLASRIDVLYHTYIEEQYDSSGAFIRLLMNAIPGLIFLARRRRFTGDPVQRMFWTLAALISLTLFAALPVFPSSTALDRVGLYFIPIQLYVFGRLPSALGETPNGVRLVSYGVILYYGAALLVWLLFAANAHAWLPYRFAPLADG